jgi:hypothetical protein
MRSSWIAAIIVVMLAAGIAAYSADSTGSTASNSGISTKNANSSFLGSSPLGNSTSSSVLATSQASTSSTVSRVADTQSTFAATVSSPVTTPTGMNTTMSNCGGVPDRPAMMELQVVSDATGMPVQQGALTVSSVFQAGCNGFEGQAHETLYFDRVSEGQSGWFDLPNNSTDNMAGAYNATVGYAGHSYSFHAGAYPASTTCAVLAAPSGVVTVTTYFFSNYDCAGSFGGWAGRFSYYCFGEVYLRVLSDSDSTPVAGAVVTTTYDIPETCGAGDPSGLTFVSFTTTNTEWYAFGDSTYSFTVATGGQIYNVTASQRPGASTCVTLHVPSGVVGMTYGPRCVVGEPSTNASTTVSSSTSSISSPACGSPTNTLLNPAPKGTVYMKVVTDQGMVITNGSLLVTQSGNFTGSWSGWGLMAHYCIRLGDINGTGYLQLGANETFLTSGYYNMTLIASSNNQGPWYSATIPSIQVHPNSTIYVTVSVPSGVVTLVTSNEGSSVVTTMTTSATTTKVNGDPSTSTSTSTSTTVNSSTTSTSISGQLLCGCWIPQGAPTYSVAGNGWVTAVVTYYNGFNSTVTGTAYLVIWNSLGQKVGIDNTTTTIPAGHEATLHPTVVGLLPDGTSRLPPGTYSTSVYATLLNGTRISVVSNGSFRDEPLTVAFTGSASSFGSGPVTFTLFFTNLYPSPLTGTLYGFANDTSGRPLFNATAAVSLSGDSGGNATLVFDTGNINYCSLDYSFVLRAPNGTALSPYDHEGGPECPPVGSLVSPPATKGVDGYNVLPLNVTNPAAVAATGMSWAVSYSSSGSVAATTFLKDIAL